MDTSFARRATLAAAATPIAFTQAKQVLAVEAVQEVEAFEPLVGTLEGDLQGRDRLNGQACVELDDDRPEVARRVGDGLHKQVHLPGRRIGGDVFEALALRRYGNHTIVFRAQVGANLRNHATIVEHDLKMVAAYDHAASFKRFVESASAEQTGDLHVPRAPRGAHTPSRWWHAALLGIVRSLPGRVQPACCMVVPLPEGCLWISVALLGHANWKAAPGPAGR